MDAEDGNEPQRHQAEALQAPGGLLAPGGGTGWDRLGSVVLVFLLHETWGPVWEAERTGVTRWHHVGNDVTKS